MEKHERMALVFKALGDSTRLQIVEMLSCGELCACDILESFKITQPTLSYHMKILKESGLVQSKKVGSWMHYSLNLQTSNDISLYFAEITTETEECVCKKKEEKVCES